MGGVAAGAIRRLEWDGRSDEVVAGIVAAGAKYCAPTIVQQSGCLVAADGRCRGGRKVLRPYGAELLKQSWPHFSMLELT